MNTMPQHDGYARVADAFGMDAPRPKLRVVGDDEREPVESNGVWRPSNLDEYVGQRRAQLKVKMHVTAALKRERQPGHILLSGPPGLGKTSLAAIVASILNEDRPEEQRVAFIETMGTTVRSQKQLAKVLARIRHGDVLFIDEAHQMGEKSEEMLGLAMEDGRVTLSPSENAEPITLDIPAFTLVAATTKPAHMSQPLRDRMKLSVRMEWYEDDELAQIVKNTAKRESVKVTDDAAKAIAQVGRQTPRTTLGVFDQVMAFGDTVGADEIDTDVTTLAFDVIGLDSLGLDERDRDYLDVIASWSGRRVGLKPAAAKSGLNEKEISDDVEPFLLRAGLLDTTSRGRCLSKRTYKHLWPDRPIPPLLGLS
jgi:holliday junction DNA helicase RuvB